MTVQVTQTTSRTHQPIPTTEFGDAFHAMLTSKNVNEMLGVTMNTISAAGRIDNVSMYNLLGMRSAVHEASFEEAPMRFLLMRRP